MPEPLTVALLLKYAAGNPEVLAPTTEFINEEVQRIRDQWPGFVLLRKHICAVLEKLRGSAISEKEAQFWARFVRWGLLPVQPSCPIFALNIEFDQTHENLIVDCLGRLDELGDEIDGTISTEEMDAMIADLKK